MIRKRNSWRADVDNQKENRRDDWTFLLINANAKKSADDSSFALTIERLLPQTQIRKKLNLVHFTTLFCARCVCTNSAGPYFPVVSGD